MDEMPGQKREWRAKPDAIYLLVASGLVALAIVAIDAGLVISATIAVGVVVERTWRLRVPALRVLCAELHYCPPGFEPEQDVLARSFFRTPILARLRADEIDCVWAEEPDRVMVQTRGLFVRTVELGEIASVERDEARLAVLEFVSRANHAI